jgi:type II secretory pathway pseudopilin PulG
MRVTVHGGTAVWLWRRPLHPVKPACVLGPARQVQHVPSSPALRTREGLRANWPPTRLMPEHVQMRRYKRAGLTLVETALMISLVGIVLAVAVPTFIKKVQISKVAEASIQLGALYRAAAAYYAVKTVDGNKPVTHCIPSEAGPAPEKPSQKPVRVDFSSNDTPGAETWRALQFNPSETLRFRYSFLPKKSGCYLEKPRNTQMITLRAEGDLDGDDEYSTFERTVIQGEHNDLALDNLLFVKDRVE